MTKYRVLVEAKLDIEAESEDAAKIAAVKRIDVDHCIAWETEVMDIDRKRDYAEIRAYDAGLADYGRGRLLSASPYEDSGLTKCWELGWQDAQAAARTRDRAKALRADQS